MGTLQDLGQSPAWFLYGLHIVQQPAPGNAAEVEVDLLRGTDVKESGDHHLSVLARGSAGDIEFGDGPILAIHPENKIQAANFTRSLFLIVVDRFRQSWGVNVLRRFVGVSPKI